MWLKIPKSLLNSSWFGHSPTLHVYVYILLNSAIKPRNAIWSGKKIILKPGQWIGTRERIAAGTGLSQSSVERALLTLKTEQQIDIKSTSKSRLFTILYDVTAEDNTTNVGQQSDSKRTTNGLQTDYSYKNKIIEEEEEEKSQQENFDNFINNMKSDVRYLEMLMKNCRLSMDQVYFQMENFFRQKKAFKKTWTSQADCNRNFFYWLNSIGEKARQPVPEVQTNKSSIDDFYNSHMGPADII